MSDVFPMVFQARRDLAATLDGVTEDQWDEQSLCTEWTCRDVLAHLVMPLELGLPKMALGILANFGNFDRYSANHAKRDRRSPSELIEVLREKAESRFSPPGLGPEAPLCDAVVHGQDICRPLGVERHVPADSMRVVLDLLTSPKATRGVQKKGLTSGLSFRADDIDWKAGEGPEVSGPAEALALALSGRTVALDDLSGAGLAELRARS